MRSWFDGSSEPAVALEQDETAPAQEGPPLVEEGIQLSPYHRFPDIPLPVGAEMDAERTFVYEDKNLQIGRMVYSVPGAVSDLAQFYVRECPVTEWKLVSLTEVGGAQLVFVKPGKRLTVSIGERGMVSGIRGRKELVIFLTPDPDS